MSEENLAIKCKGIPKKWSFMVYLAGADDVSDEARESLLRMKQIGSTDHIHVIAQFDSGNEGIFTKRYYLSPFKNALGIEALLRQASAEIPATLERYNSTAGRNYCHRLREALSVSQRKRLDEMKTEDMIELLKYSPDRFKSFVLNCILDEDIYPHPSGSLGATNAGDPKVLVKFIQWAKVRYPAEHYMVVLWGHGSGLSVAWDYPSSLFVNSADALTIQELKKAFREEKEESRKEEEESRKEEEESQKKAEKSQKKGRKCVPGVDIVGFNSCSLGTIEVCYELRDLIKFGIASEGFTPKTSWPYDRILKDLDENYDWKPEDFADKIVEEYIKYYEEPVRTAEEIQKIERKAVRLGASLDMNTGWGQYKSSSDLNREKPKVDLNREKPKVDLSKEKPSVDLGSQGVTAGGGIDLSVCNLKKSEMVIKAVNDLVDRLLGKLNRHFDADVFASILAAHAVSQSYFNKDFTDLYDFCRALRSFCPKNGSIKNGCKAVMEAILAMCNPGHSGSDVSNSYGVSIFFPWNDWGEEDVIARYKNLDFIKDTKWSTFLRTYRKLAYQFEEGTNAFKDSKREAVLRAKKREAALKLKKERLLWQ